MHIDGNDDKGRLVVTLTPGRTYVFTVPDTNGRHQILSHSPRDGSKVIVRCDDLFESAPHPPLDIS